MQPHNDRSLFLLLSFVVLSPLADFPLYPNPRWCVYCLSCISNGVFYMLFFTGEQRGYVQHQISVLWSGSQPRCGSPLRWEHGLRLLQARAGKWVGVCGRGWSLLVEFFTKHILPFFFRCTSPFILFQALSLSFHHHYADTHARYSASHLNLNLVRCSCAKNGRKQCPTAKSWLATRAGP